MLINNYHVLQRVSVFVEQITFEKVLNDPTLQSKYEATQEENQKVIQILEYIRVDLAVRKEKQVHK